MAATMKKLNWKGKQIESPFTDEEAANILKDMMETNEFAGQLYLKYCQQKRGTYQLSAGQLFWVHKLSIKYFLEGESNASTDKSNKSKKRTSNKAKTKKAKPQSVKCEISEKDIVDVAVIKADEPISATSYFKELPAQKTFKELPAKEPSNPVLPLVRSDLDDYGLTPHEFRVYAHIVRRTGGIDGECFARLELIAALCEMSVRRV